MQHNLSVPLSSGALTVQPNGQKSKSRSFVVMRDLGPTHALGVYNNNIRTVERAFKERYFYCKTSRGYELALPVRPRTYRNNVHLGRFRSLVVDKCRNAPVVSVHAVVESYTGPKRRIYEQAMVSLTRERISEKDARLTSFVKFEKQDLGKAPRVINPRSPRYNLKLGKYLKFLEKRVYKAINKAYGARTPHTVIKGLNVEQAASVVRQKWERFRRPIAIGLDASKFDMHTSITALKYEHSFYNGIFNSSELRALLRMQLHNRGTAYCEDGKVKFSMNGTRSSGDLNTSLGNCIIMCALVYAYKEECGVDLELCNNGDDCVVILEKEDEEKFRKGLDKWFTKYGYRMTVEPTVDVFEQIDFCQSRPVYDGSKYVMVRNLSNSLLKDPICLIPIQSGLVLRKWFQAVGECGASLTRGIPVLQSYYQMYQRAGIKCSDGFKSHVFKNTSLYERVTGLQERVVEVCAAAARASFYYAFGVLPEHQILLEEHLNRVVMLDEIEDAQHEDLSLDKHDNACPWIIQSLFLA